MPPNHRDLGLTVSIADALDPELWKKRYAPGIVLGRGAPPVEDAILDSLDPTIAAQQEAADLARELPAEVIQWHLRVAMSDLELKLGVPFGLVVCKATPVDSGLVQGTHYDVEVPRREYLVSQVEKHYRIDLPSGVISVQRIRLYWYDQLVWTIDGSSDSVHLEHPGVSSLHVMPTTGALFTLGPFMLQDPAFSLFQGLSLGGPRALPDAWAVDYTLGPKTKTGVQGLELVLADWVATRAAKPLFAIASQMRTQGIAGASIGIDGLSKSVQLQGGGAIHALLSQQFEQINQSIDWQRLAARKRPMRVRGAGY